MLSLSKVFALSYLFASIRQIVNDDRCYSLLEKHVAIFWRSNFQNRAARVIANSSYDAPAEALVKMSNGKLRKI